MTWVRVDDNFTDHPKIMGLGGIPQRWAWLEILCYCARFRTDGTIPDAIVGHGQITRGLIDKAITQKLIDVDEDGVLHVHDWDLYNTRDATAAERQQRWRERHANGAAGIPDLPEEGGAY